MVDSKKSLLLYLKFDELAGISGQAASAQPNTPIARATLAAASPTSALPTTSGDAATVRLADASGNDQRAEAHGAPAIIPDDTFGSCMRLDGTNDYIDVPPASIPTGNEISVSFWANGADSLPKNTCIIEAADANKARTLNIAVPWGDSSVYFDCGNVGGTYDRLTQAAQPDVYKGAWVHWAFTKNAATGDMKIFRNGALWNSATGQVRPLPASTVVRVGASLDGASYYQGKIAHLRVYNWALAAEEISADIQTDQTALASFRKSYPIQFGLYNDDNQSVIYITDNPAGENLTLEVSNVSGQTIVFTKPDNQTPNASNYHLALRFRPGTLSNDLLASIGTTFQTALQPNGWNVGYVQDPSGVDVIYFLSTGERTLNPNDSVTLTLPHIRASGEEGARGTRVELKYRQLAYKSEIVPISGNRLIHMNILNQIGQKTISLHVGFLGSNTILNDGKSQNQLILRIVNVSKDHAIPLNLDTSKTPSKITLSFDSQGDKETKEWALGTTSQVADIHAAIKARGEWLNPPNPSQSISPQWTFEPHTQKELVPNDAIQITLTNIQSSLPSGQTNLYVRYENIPGYWDGQFIVTIEKSPLLYAGSFVGIGTIAPGRPLSIVAVNASQELVEFKDPTGITKWHINQMYAGAGLNVVESGIADGRLFIQAGGNVGIGLTGPSERLDVAGNIKIGGSRLKSAQGNAILQTDATDWLRINPDEQYPAIALYKPVALGSGGLAVGEWSQLPTGQLKVTGDASLAVGGGKVTVGTTNTSLNVDSRLTVNAASAHLQLRREATTGGGNLIFLELYQDNAPAISTYPSIRFHQSNKFWHRIEGRPEGFHFKDGNPSNDNLTNISANNGKFNSLQIGGITIREHELQILQKLAAGQLDFDLYNIKQDEFAYAADYHPFDDDRRNVWTWRKKGRINQGRWRIAYPG